MADLRFDPIAGIWVAIASRRRERPMEFIPLEQLHQQIICPFCGGNEEETPELITAYRSDGQTLGVDDDPTDWASRIVPNKYPSLNQAATGSDCGPYQCSHQDGVQELVIPTPRHISSISDLTDDELKVCWTACQDRVSTLRQRPGIDHVMLFMNSRLAAGASLEHIHFQIMGSPLVSPYLEFRRHRDNENRKQNGESLVASLLSWELEQNVRILKETDRFVMLCPYASRFSFQVWIVPKDSSLPFKREPIDFNAELALLCKQYTKKLEQLIENAAYNLLVNLAPNQQTEGEHWFVEIFPRLNRMAGYEIGTDIWVNPVPPEIAAKKLASP